jgi:organic hydroperoxide reductase OsmC/OhrA
VSDRRRIVTKFTVSVNWERRGAVFIDNRYSRRHEWRFDGGTVVPASSSPHVVPAPMSDASGVDPEEAFVASLSSCHMLWFLSIAAKQGFVVESYHDNPEAIMGKNDDGKVAIIVVTLRPTALFGGNKTPQVEEILQIHDKAHQECFIGNSVKSDVRLVPVF